MYAIKTPAVEKEVLAAIAKYGLETYSDLYKRKITKYSRGGIQKALRRLLKKKLIEIKKEEKLASGLTERWYDINLLGLLHVFSLAPELWEQENIDSTAKIHAEKLPLIFGLWDYFEANAKRMVIARMQLCTLPIPEKILIHPLRLELEALRKNFESRLREDFTREVLFPDPLFHPGVSKDSGWDKVLLGHLELKRYVNQELNRRENESQKELDIIQLWREHIRKWNNLH